MPTPLERIEEDIHSEKWEKISEDKSHQYWRCNRYGELAINLKLLNFILHQELQKAREEERERIEDAFAKVADYTEDLSADAYGEPINTSFYRLYEGQWEWIIKPKDQSELDQDNK